jgi:hypothetical protein
MVFTILKNKRIIFEERNTLTNRKSPFLQVYQNYFVTNPFDLSCFLFVSFFLLLASGQKINTKISHPVLGWLAEAKSYICIRSQK